MRGTNCGEELLIVTRFCIENNRQVLILDRVVRKGLNMNFNVSLGNDHELVEIAFWRIFFFKLPFGTFVYII